MSGPVLQPWTGTVLLLPGGQVLLAGSALLDVARALRAAQRVTYADGITPPERWRQLLELVLAAAAGTGPTSAAGSAELPRMDERALCELDLIDTTEAAHMLGCTARNVRDLSRRQVLTSGRLVGGRLLLERVEVRAEVLRRAEARISERNRCA